MHRGAFTASEEFLELVKSSLLAALEGILPIKTQTSRLSNFVM